MLFKKYQNNNITNNAQIKKSKLTESYLTEFKHTYITHTRNKQLVKLYDFIYKKNIKNLMAILKENYGILSSTKIQLKYLWKGTFQLS